MGVAFAALVWNGRAIMRRPMHLILILCLVLTGVGLGAARGTVLRADRMVLCTGHGVVVVDHPDGTGEAWLCPDMALSLLVAMPDTPPPPTVPRPSVEIDRQAPGLPARGLQSPRPMARDPPGKAGSFSTTA